MKIRAYLEKKRLKIVGSVIVCSLLFVPFLESKSDPFAILLVLLASLTCYMLFYFYLRCPKCNGNIASSMFHGQDILHIAKNIKCCPHCGASFDEEI